MFDSSFKKISNSYLLTFFIFFFAFILRFYKFDSLGFWGDEILTFGKHNLYKHIMKFG